MLKLEGAMRAASRICSLTSASTCTASNSLMALLSKMASSISLIVPSMLSLQHKDVAIATYFGCLRLGVLFGLPAHSADLPFSALLRIHDTGSIPIASKKCHASQSSTLGRDALDREVPPCPARTSGSCGFRPYWR